MRLGVLGLGLLAAVAAHGQRNSKDDIAATKRACGVEDCFYERDVRDFDVIDQSHLIVYTGSQRCPFHVELRGTLCDLTFAPELYFSRTNEISDAGVPVGGEAFGGPAVDPFGVFETNRGGRHLRICANDLSVQVHGGRFTESATAGVQTDRFGNPIADCQVTTVTSITDDQLVEILVGHGVIPPLPPMGTGEIEVGEQQDEREE